MLHVFDLDHTLLKGNASFHFYFYLLRQKIYPLSSLFSSVNLFLRYRFSFLDLADFHKRAFSLFLKGFSEKHLQNLSIRFAEEYWKKMQFMPAVQCLQKAQQEGHVTLILSSSPTFLIEPLAQKFQVTACKGTEYMVDKEEGICHISSLMLGPKKASILRSFAQIHQVSSEDTIAYSDSITDLPFLESAGRAIAVNPDAKLRKICKERGWQML